MRSEHDFEALDSLTHRQSKRLQHRQGEEKHAADPLVSALSPREYKPALLNGHDSPFSFIARAPSSSDPRKQPCSDDDGPRERFLTERTNW